MGAHFAKWRAVIRVTDTLPSPDCVSVNNHALARYASLCQERGLVPIIEPEVLMDGPHTIECCDEVTGFVLRAVFELDVALEGMLIKPNMVIASKECTRRVSVEEVATATCAFTAAPPAAVPGIAPLWRSTSTPGDRPSERDQRPLPPKPWKVSFSYGCALQDARWTHGTAGTRICRLASGRSMCSSKTRDQRRQ